MTFLLLKNYDHYVIRNDDADFIVGRVYPLNSAQGPYKVTSNITLSYQSNEIAVVKSLDEAVPAFIEFCGRNPVPWEQESPALHWRNTTFVVLRVERDQQGHWLAYRDDYPLLRDTKPARFAKCLDAQRSADAHELDLYPNAKVIDDGLSWLPNPEINWRSIPHLAQRGAPAGNGVRPAPCLDLAVTQTRRAGTGRATTSS